MQTNDKIFLIVGDLGFGLFDQIRKDFPDRFINANAAEQGMMGIGVGLAMSDKIPFIYSITPFLLFRTAETIRNYVNHENIPTRLIASGRDDCYKHDGHSHAAFDTKPFLNLFENINQYWPDSADDIPDMVDGMIKSNNASFISLKR